MSVGETLSISDPSLPDLVLSTESLFCSIVDISQLLDDPDQRGSDRTIPNVAGVVPYRRAITSTQVNLEVIVRGIEDADGSLHSDVRTGLALNRARIRQYTRPVDSTDGTRIATLAWQALPELATRVHVLGLQAAGATSDMQRGVLRLSFPDGLFSIDDWVDAS